MIRAGCTRRDNLEFHHDIPYTRGGDHGPENIHLACGTHNDYLAERDYGKEVMKRYRRSTSRVREPAPVYYIREPAPADGAAPESRYGGDSFDGKPCPEHNRLPSTVR